MPMLSEIRLELQAIFLKHRKPDGSVSMLDVWNDPECPPDYLRRVDQIILKAFGGDMASAEDRPGSADAGSIPAASTSQEG